MAEPQLSVVIPYGYSCSDLSTAIDSIQRATSTIEIIIVTDEGMRDQLKQYDQEVSIITSDKTGRGYFCSIGARMAKSPIILFLHADTFLPTNWDKAIISALEHPLVSGGAFMLQFRGPGIYFRILSRLYNWFAQITKECWGDRAIFIKTEILVPFIEQIELPIMEDIALSRIIRHSGKLIMLNEMITTGVNHFEKKGMLSHIIHVLSLRMRYALGMSAKSIFEQYYGMESKP